MSNKNNGNTKMYHKFILFFLVSVVFWFMTKLSKEYDNFLAHEVSVILEDPVSGAPGKLCLRRIKIINREGQLVATTHTHQGSGNIHSMVAHNGLTLLPPDSSGEVGDRVNALWFR
jgi:molybdopterin biosynthesis enzyme